MKTLSEKPPGIFYWPLLFQMIVTQLEMRSRIIFLVKEWGGGADFLRKEPPTGSNKTLPNTLKVETRAQVPPTSFIAKI